MRFGGTLSAAAKPNVNLTRRPAERPSSPAPSGRSTPSATPPRVTPPSSPRFYRPVSPFSLPPSLQPCHVGGEDQLFSSG
ncbi:unnamed protein product [Boreogadus saida]